MKLTIVRFGMAAPENRNFTCDRCKVTTHPKRFPSGTAWQHMARMENTLRFTIRMDPEHWVFVNKPFDVTVCRDCAAPFAEMDRLYWVSKHHQANWKWLSEHLAAEGETNRMFELEDLKKVLTMQGCAYTRWQEEEARVNQLVESWWPGLEKLVIDHEQFMLPEGTEQG